MLPVLKASASNSSATTAPQNLELSKDQVNALVQDAVVWASQHGLVVGLPSSMGAPDMAVIHAPLAALPVAFPKER